MKTVNQEWPLVDALFRHYLEHQDAYVDRFDGKVLVIHQFKVVEAFSTFAEAYDYATQHFVPGEFIIQKCSAGKADYSMRVYSPFTV